MLFLADRFIITCLLSNNHLILLTNSPKKLLITVSDCSPCTFKKKRGWNIIGKKQKSLRLSANRLRCLKLWSFPAFLIAVKRLFHSAIWWLFFSPSHSDRHRASLVRDHNSASEVHGATYILPHAYQTHSLAAISSSSGGDDINDFQHHLEKQNNTIIVKHRYCFCRITTPGPS